MITPERRQRIEQVVRGRQQGTVVLEDVHDPHNLAAVLRSCDAFGIQTVHIIFVREAPFDPRSIGKVSSSSANKWIDYVIHRSTEACLNRLHEEDYETVATVIDESAENLIGARFQNPKTAFLLGNEHRGLSEAAVRLARRRLTIPMRGMVESLNLSVTASLLLYELTRQRSERGEEVSLTESERLRLKESFERNREDPITPTTR